MMWDGQPGQAQHFSLLDHIAGMPDEADAKKTPSYYMDKDYPARPESQ